MSKKLKIFLLLFLIIMIGVSSYFLLKSTIENNKSSNLKSLLNVEQKQFLKKYAFPYRMISEQDDKILKLQSYILNLELDKKQSGTDIGIKESSIKLSNNKTLKRYKLISGFNYGISNRIPGSGYIDFFKNNLFILSSRGVLAFRKNLSENEVNFKQIKNNIHDFIGIEQFNKSHKFSLKDLLIFNEKIYVSYIEEIKKDCWNTSIIFGNINYESISFEKLFSPRECIHSKNNIDKEWEIHQSGGRLASFDDNYILFSIGEYRSRHLAQNKESVNGKILKINVNNGDYEIISMGHRNPQGLYFDKENNFILETEHGPKGGDEINLIQVNKISDDKIQNYGWAISSAGTHYEGKWGNKKRYEKYPLYNSHSEHGFIEPLNSFVPSIGISEIVKTEKNKYIVSSLRDKSLYYFELNKQREIINLNRVEVFERIRDLRFKDNKLYLFMEDSASIGVINLN